MESEKEMFPVKRFLGKGSECRAKSHPTRNYFAKSGQLMIPEDPIRSLPFESVSKSSLLKKEKKVKRAFPS